MTRNSNALMRDGSVMADSDLVDFLSGPTDSAINFNGSADLHTPIHPPLNRLRILCRASYPVYVSRYARKRNILISTSEDCFMFTIFGDFL